MFRRPRPGAAIVWSRSGSNSGRAAPTVFTTGSATGKTKRAGSSSGWLLETSREKNKMGDDLITNRKAHRDYEILETYEAGIVLCGTEVKSLRAGQGNLTDAFARIEKNEVWLYNFDIQPYKQAHQFN